MIEMEHPSQESLLTKLSLPYQLPETNLCIAGDHNTRIFNESVQKRNLKCSCNSSNYQECISSKNGFINCDNHNLKSSINAVSASNILYKESFTNINRNDMILATTELSNSSGTYSSEHLLRSTEKHEENIFILDQREFIKNRLLFQKVGSITLSTYTKKIFTTRTKFKNFLSGIIIFLFITSISGKFINIFG